jgi:FixJ family two-component response regulator
MSGESLPHETLAAQQSNAVTFLWKPFRTEALLDAVTHGLTLYDQLSG